jgi:hypothetical protein
MLINHLDKMPDLSVSTHPRLQSYFGADEACMLIDKAMEMSINADNVNMF